jgi:hypothetical protein
MPSQDYARFKSMLLDPYLEMLKKLDTDITTGSILDKKQIRLLSLLYTSIPSHFEKIKKKKKQIKYEDLINDDDDTDRIYDNSDDPYNNSDCSYNDSDDELIMPNLMKEPILTSDLALKISKESTAMNSSNKEFNQSTISLPLKYIYKVQPSVKKFWHILDNPSTHKDNQLSFVEDDEIASYKKNIMNNPLVINLS